MLLHLYFSKKALFVKKSPVKAGLFSLLHYFFFGVGLRGLVFGFGGSSSGRGVVISSFFTVFPPIAFRMI